MKNASKAKEEGKLTPVMQQWHSCKATAKQALLLFRLGDFYEAFYEDAEILARELSLTLTQRQGVAMAGVPHHAAEGYIDKLVSKGYHVAIAEQIEETGEKQTKGLVRREITRCITPGTLINSSLLGEKAPNFIVSLTQVGALFGLAVAEITTGVLRVTEIEDLAGVTSELCRLAPAEIVLAAKFREKHSALWQKVKSVVSPVAEWFFDPQLAYRKLTQHFHVAHLEGFGLKGRTAALNAAGALLTYLSEELSINVDPISSLKFYSTEEYLLLDRGCQLNLELLEPQQGRSRESTLLHLIDHTVTPMGGRLIREWLSRPLLNLKEISRRHDAVETLFHLPIVCHKLQENLRKIRDLERLITKLETGYATPRDLLAIRLSLEASPLLQKCLQELCLSPESLLQRCRADLIDLPEATQLLQVSLVEEPPLRLSEGRIFRDGFHPPLDELRKVAYGGKEWLLNYQTELREKTGIKTLKISFNKIFGYYVEVSKGQAALMPAEFERRQTVVNAERFVSPLLHNYETKLLNAEEQIRKLEQQLFEKLRGELLVFKKQILQLAAAVAHIDVFVSLAQLAHKQQYCRPQVDASKRLHIIAGRHPVVEASVLSSGFIPNDTHLQGDGERLMLITGPNMGGKSTYLRQVALIVILAQMGSFVPARSAEMGVVDRIFTRIGAHDDLSQKLSTFMVEMSETANILNNLTPHSLVLLDEIGRGTSTYDGLSIAWAVAEHLLASEAKTLFATHYGELTALEKLPGAVNYQAAVQEQADQICFLHKIVRGKADRSYGIHVAKLAGLPAAVVGRATTLLKQLEGREKGRSSSKKEHEEIQLALF